MGNEQKETSTSEEVTHTWFLFILGTEPTVNPDDMRNLLTAYNIHTSDNALQQATKFGYKVCLFAWGTDGDVGKAVAMSWLDAREQQTNPLCIVGAFRSTDDDFGLCIGDCTPSGRAWAWKGNSWTTSRAGTS